MLMRVLLADGCAFTRDGLCAFLAQQGLEIVGECHDWETLLARAGEVSPDVVFFSSALRGLAGPAAFQPARRANSLFASPRWLVFGDHPTPEAACAWLEAGAAGYVWKEDAPEWVLAGIQAVQDGRTWISPNVEGRPAENGAALSDSERQLLRWLAQGKTNDWIAGQWGLAPRTARYHLTKLYRKLNVSGRTEAAAWVGRQGLDRE